MGNKFLGIRIVMLVIAFGVVAYTMLRLNQQAEDPTAKQDPTGKERLTWCHTRVQGIKDTAAAKPYAILQEGSDWRLTEPEKRSLNQLELEKWFGQHCSVWVEKLSISKVNEPRRNKGEIVVNFIDKSEERFMVLDEDLFFFKGTLFRSEEWVKALTQLRELSGLK